MIGLITLIEAFAKTWSCWFPFLFQAIRMKLSKTTMQLSAGFLDLYADIYPEASRIKNSHTLLSKG